jgi:endonuclease I
MTIRWLAVFLNLLLIPVSYAQTVSGNQPANYYQSANGLTCAALKSSLSAIITNGYNELQYLELWATYTRTDKKRNDANTADVVWDMYSDNPNGPDPYTYSFIVDQCGQYNKEGDCYNREHTFPQSWFNELQPMKSDMNHIFPTDGEVNGIRSNFPFGEVSNVSITTRNGSKLGTGNNFGYTGTVFEPINEYKGDIARAVLYMSVRYENLIGGWINNGNANEVLNGTSYPVFDPWQIRLLYKWHIQDPVSVKEIRRNDSVFVIQKNRNPFIDRPEWVYDIWSCTGLIMPTSVTEQNISSDDLILFPLPASTSDIIKIRWQQPLMKNSIIQVVSVAGQIISTYPIQRGSMNTQLKGLQLTPGIYLVKLLSEKYYQTTRLIIR